MSSLLRQLTISLFLCLQMLLPDQRGCARSHIRNLKALVV